MNLESKKKQAQDNNVILAFSALASNKSGCVVDIGKGLETANADLLTDGGFFLWKIGTEQEYYSSLFREVLGYENEKDFPNLSSSWQNIIFPEDLDKALYNFNKSILNHLDSPYYQNVKYKTKDGGVLKVTCSGLIISIHGEKYLIGTHKIIV